MFFFCSSLLLIILIFGIILFCHFYSALPGAKEEGEERRGEGTGVYQTFVFHALISMRFLLLWRSIDRLGEGRESVVSPRHYSLIQHGRLVLFRLVRSSTRESV